MNEQIKKGTKKNMKRKKVSTAILTGAMAFSGVAASAPFALAPVTAIAADDGSVSTSKGIATVGSGSASISIVGNEGQTLVGKKFNVYKLFNAENSEGGESINYTFNPAYEKAIKTVVAARLTKAGTTQVNANDVTEYQAIDYIQSLNNHKVEGATADQTLEGRYSSFRYFVEEVRSEIEKEGGTPIVVKATSVINGTNSIKIDGLDYGYYLADEVTNVQDTNSAASLCMVNTANPNASVVIKSDYPTLIKKINEDDNNVGWNDMADYEIGQTVPYKYTSTIPDINGFGTYYYAWHDKMDSALTFKKDSVQVTIKGVDDAGKDKEYTLQPSEFKVVENPGNDETFKIEVNDIKAIVDREFDNANKDKENVYGQTVTVRYDATLNDNAAKKTGRPGFENDVRLEFSNDFDSNGDGTTGFTPWDTVVAFTYKLNVLKTNNHDKVLGNAKFRLYSDKECKNEVFVKKSSDGYVVINRDSAGGTDHSGGAAPANAVEMSSSNDGTFVIFGLDQGTYYLKETKAPAGYRCLKAPITLTVTPTFTTDRNGYVKGDGATAKTLKALDVAANIESYYDGKTTKEDQNLTTDVATGSANLTVVNQVGMKLPITGTSALMLTVLAGGALMATAVVVSKKKKVTE